MSNLPHWRKIQIPLQFKRSAGLGKYVLVFSDRLGGDMGDTQSETTNSGKPRRRTPRIRIHPALLGEDKSQRELIEVVVHEITHGCGWHLSEDTAADIGEVSAEALWQLGFRRIRKDEV